MESVMATLYQRHPAVADEEKIAVTIASVITSYYGRGNIELDDEFSFEFPFSTKRKVAVYVVECDEPGHELCFRAVVHIYDPSLTPNYSEDCWDGIGPVSPGTFSVAEFVSVLGLASLNGGLASIEVKIHFYREHVPKMAHLIMQIAGLVHMFP